MKTLRRKINVYEDKLLCEGCNRILGKPEKKRGIYVYTCKHCKTVTINEDEYPKKIRLEEDLGVMK